MKTPYWQRVTQNMRKIYFGLAAYIGITIPFVTTIVLNTSRWSWWQLALWDYGVITLLLWGTSAVVALWFPREN